MGKEEMPRGAGPWTAGHGGPERHTEGVGITRRNEKHWVGVQITERHDQCALWKTK